MEIAKKIRVNMKIFWWFLIRTKNLVLLNFVI